MSVSRVGSASQIKAMKQIAGTLKLELAQYREVEAFASFASELEVETQDTLYRGFRLIELLKQKQGNPLPAKIQIIMLYAGMRGYLDPVAVENVSKYKVCLEEYAKSTNILKGFIVSNAINDGVLKKFLSEIVV